VASLKIEWETEVDRLFHLNNPGKPAQSEVIGAMCIVLTEIRTSYQTSAMATALGA